jgi:hypothetical protein
LTDADASPRSLGVFLIKEGKLIGENRWNFSEMCCGKT